MIKKYLGQSPILAPLLDSHTNELYLWHGNTHQFIAGITSKHHEIGLALRTAIQSGSGGFYFSDKAPISNKYSTCSVCNGGGYGATAGPCYCSTQVQVFTLLLCRVLLGKIQCVFNFDHDEFNRMTKSPSFEGDKPDSLLGVGTGAEAIREIIINDESQIYPEFIIQYRRGKIGKDSGHAGSINQTEWNQLNQPKDGAWNSGSKPSSKPKHKISASQTQLNNQLMQQLNGKGYKDKGEKYDMTTSFGSMTNQSLQESGMEESADQYADTTPLSSRPENEEVHEEKKKKGWLF